MAKTVKPYPEQDLGKKAQVAQMFDQISPKYDLLNKVLSLGIDKIWRKKAIQMLQKHQPKIILDVATGTGDFAIETLKLNPEKIIGVDISEGMLKVGQAKIEKLGITDKIELVLGDSEKLPFQDNTFDAVTVAFGVRNFENLPKGLSDIYRVLKPTGILIVLEFSNPKAFPIKQIFGFYSKYILPNIGKMISKDKNAYTYLPESVKHFPEGSDFKKVMIDCGFENVTDKRLTFGICSIYSGTCA